MSSRRTQSAIMREARHTGFKRLHGMVVTGNPRRVAASMKGASVPPGLAKQNRYGSIRVRSNVSVQFRSAVSTPPCAIV